MANQFVFANNVKTTVGATFSNTATTLTLSSSANLPTLAAGQLFPITLNDAATGLIYEIMYATAISGANITVTRGEEGTTAQNWSVGDRAFCDFTAGTVQPADYLWQPAGTPSGLLNGSNMTYNLPAPPAGSLPIYKNGVLWIPSVDYTISGGTLTNIGPAMVSTDSLYFLDYRI